MTLQEAIMDKNRPLSVSPHEWMQYEQAKQYEQEELIENEIKRIVAIEENKDDEDVSDIKINVEEKLDISIEQMVLGCKMSMRILQELDRKNVSPLEREVYNEIKKNVYNAIAPYLVDILKIRKRLYKENK